MIAPEIPGAGNVPSRSWRYSVFPSGNANVAWVQHIVHHPAPAGVAGFAFANGSMSSNHSGECSNPGVTRWNGNQFTPDFRYLEHESDD